MPLIRCCAALLACLALAACDPGVPAEALDANQVTRVILGPLDVELTVRTSESATASQTLEGATRIELHDRYVVLRDREGRGSLIALERLVGLTWTKK